MAHSSSDSILVTGAAGFIGARFVESCRRQGMNVISVDDRGHFRSREEHRGMDFGTIVDREDLFSWLASERPRISAFMHIGACSDTMQTDVAYLRRVNVEYSQKAWDYCAAEKIPFVYASSAATYGDGENGYDDDEALIPRLKPLNAYGQSKQDFDVWALAQEKRGHRPPAWSGFKFFNVYGFGERHKTKMASVILHAFDQIRAGGRVRLFRSHKEGIPDGHQKRDFIWVDDVVKVLHFARTKPLPRGIYNLGTGQARTFLDLARATFAALGVPEQIDWVDTPVSIRDKYQYFTEAKMERLRALGYREPFASLEDGVRAYVKQLVAAAKA